METQSIPWREKVQLIVRFLRGSIHYFVVALLCACLGMVFNALTPQVIRLTVDSILGAEQPSLPAFLQPLLPLLQAQKLHALWLAAAAVLLLALLRGFCNYGQRTQLSRGSESFVKRIRDGLYDHIQHLSFSWHTAHSTGEIIQRCTSDIDTMKNFISEQMTSILRIIILLVMAVIFMLGMNVRLTIIALIPVPIIICYSLLYYKRVGDGFLDCDENEGKLSAMAQENLTGVRVVRAFGRERYERDRFEDQNEYYTSKWVRLAKVMSRYWSSSDVLSGTEVLLVVVFGAVFTLRGEITAGEYVTFISYNSMLVWPVRMLGRMISEMSKAGVSVERIAYIMNSPVEQDKPGTTEPDLSGDIRFEHVNFAYEGCPEILHDIDFTMPAGSVLGILGGTGSGKSTMMFLLDKLYELPPENGRISIGGVDINDISTPYLRENIGMVLQEPFLFSRSIAENISIAGEEVDMAAVREASRAACLDETVEGFTQGYDTFVGERGVTLSGGQKQRAAIARTLMRRQPIMIFDDSLSAVDTETDAKIRAELERRFGSASIILISHRITTLAKAGQILVLDKGRIAERGTHDELVAANGIYRKIYDIQTAGTEEAAK